MRRIRGDTTRKKIEKGSKNNKKEDEALINEDNIIKKKQKTPKPRRTTFFQPRTLYGIAIVNILIVTFGLQQIYYKYYVQPQLSVTKTTLPLIINISQHESLKWSTYRPHLYFGLRTKHPTSPLFGIMWYEQPNLVTPLSQTPLRHWCDNGDSVKNYVWLFHDGRSYGKQKINDERYQLNTSFIADEHSWSSSITVNNTSKYIKKNLSLILYFSSQDNKTLFIYDEKNNKIKGNSKSHGYFEMTFHTLGNVIDKSFTINSTLIQPTNYKDYIMDNSVLNKKTNNYELRNNQKTRDGSKFIAIQFNIKLNGTVYITYQSKKGNTYIGEEYDNKLKSKTNEFLTTFEEKFNLKNKNVTLLHKNMGRVVLSNMLGGIGFFYGSNIVKSKYSTTDILQYYGPHSLLTGVPSRTLFPRGFLWDEAFHNILIRKFDPELSFEIFGSWLDTINIEGWIPREMILGSEAEARVPAEFVVQKDDVANPPAFFYLLELFLQNQKFIMNHKEELSKLYPRLQLWYTWLKRSQSGKVRGTFRWRDRNDDVTKVLNPKTLSSGLDDYPRASNPSEDEYHLDLRCWMALCSKVMRRLTEILKSDDIGLLESFRSEEEELNNYETLKKLHWSEESKAFSDYGNHSMSVALERELYYDNNGYMQYKSNKIFYEKGKLRFVDDVFGYNSLFPFLLKQIPPKASELKIMLDKISDPNILWSKYGLRSISKSSPYYNKKNTEHDPPYWRGNIWMNINYMALSSLKYYADIRGPYQRDALTIYEKLQSNVVSNVANVYKKTGYTWEHYNDQNGNGQGTRPFNGWSSLVLSMLSGDFN
uniref:Mannosyl-oligosaccharide glucosidase n=1 Tax=Parastrongyloides trichosuri TaxID=131310 RepID=A0A0N4ZL92_PARTI